MIVERLKTGWELENSILGKRNTKGVLIGSVLNATEKKFAEFVLQEIEL
jgi:hypothetical protein